MKNKFLLLIVFLLICDNLISGNPASDNYLLGSKYGLSAYYDYNMHAVDMRQLSTVADSVPRSALGNNSGFTIGAFYEYRLTDRTSIILRGTYSNQKAEIKGKTPETLLFNGIDTLGWSEHTLKTDLSNARIEPLIKYRLFNKFALYGGFSAGVRFDKTFTNDEIVKDPEGALFNNGLNTRTDIDVEKKDVLGLQAAILVGFSFDIPLNYNGKWLLLPEVMFATGFSDITNDISWDANSFRLGFSLMYSENPTIIKDSKEFREKKQDIKTINVENDKITKENLKKGLEYITFDTLASGFDIYITENTSRIDTLFFPLKSPLQPIKLNNTKAKAEEIVKNGCLTFFSVGSDGTTEFLNAKLKIEEFLSTRIQPILNYVFFEPNSSKIPVRYSLLSKDAKERFNFDDLINQSRLTTYYHILNIIGRRLEQNDKAKIILVGCNSGVSSEADNLKLSQERAEEVKKYFVDVWNIKPDRISVRATNLPEKASNSQELDGIEENRRVEIICDNPEILAPLISSDTLREAKPSQIRFYNNANNCMEIDKWVLDISQNKKDLITFRGEGKIPERLIWRINDNYYTIPRGDEKVIFKFEISDYEGLKFERRIDSIEVQQITMEEKHLNPEGDKSIDKYSLILFDYDQATLNKQNEKIMDFINSKIRYNSKVTIKGYTDRMGEDFYNLNLSQKRAEAVSTKIKNSKDILFEGLGEKELLYNNDFPEGRFYSRTVNITVETPLESK